MNRKIEFTIYVIIFCIFGAMFVESNPTSYLYYSIALCISFGVMMIISRYIISPKIVDRKFGYSFTLFAITFTVLFLITGHFYAQYLAELIKIESVSYFENVLLKDTVPFLIVASVIGFLNLIDLRKKIIKKALYYFTATLAIVIIGFSIKYSVDINYNGDNSIRFVNGDYKNLMDLLNQKEFSDKVVYVDLWYSSCGACIADFGKLSEFKKGLKNQEIEYLYLARETSHPNSFQLWKNAIKKYNIEGWHVYMNKELEKNVWELIKDNSDKKDSENIVLYYPHYLIVDRTKIISYDAERPSNELIDKIKLLTTKESN